ncbi:MAG: MBL fold metallo-hydrolase [Dehalococcoidia bacterium]|nr:MBL fold metallo-hydrolase [Dehalococcoidia bacterium]
MASLVFLGTKGEIEESSPRHSYHSSLLIESGSRIVIDYGVLRKHSLDEIGPDALFITHAHPDHYAWLKEEIYTDIPVYLTRETLDYGKYKPRMTKVLEPGTPVTAGHIEICPYRVIHSTRAPAVGYRLTVANRRLVYNPDLVDIVDKDAILQGVDYYIGDGSSIRANLVRRRGETIFGHARISTQINWCRRHGIENIIFTHLGKETIEKEDEFRNDHPDISMAYDGMALEI